LIVARKTTLGRWLEVEFKPPFILVKSQKLSSVFDVLGQKRAVGFLGWAALVSVPVIAATGMLLLLLSLHALISRPEVQEAQREAGVQSLLLIPGLNPYLPILYGWLGLVIALIVHEGMHGVLARRLGYSVRSSGLILFTVIPIGAFVETDEEEMKTGKARDVVRILAGGPASNIAVALISLSLLIFLTSSLQPATIITVESVIDGSPAAEAGLRPGDVITKINNTPVTSLSTLYEAISAAGYNGEVIIEVSRGGGETSVYRVGVADLGAGRPMIGVRLMYADIQEWASRHLQTYKSAYLRNPLIYLLPPSYPGSLHPFSETQICTRPEGAETECLSLSSLYIHPVMGGSGYQVTANALYWIWFVNFNVGIFNALPIYPLDGGQIFRRTISSLLGKRLGEQGVRAATLAISLAVVGVVLSLFLIPYLSLLF